VGIILRLPPSQEMDRALRNTFGGLEMNPSASTLAQIGMPHRLALIIVVFGLFNYVSLHERL
jgi:hypothetical protein